MNSRNPKLRRFAERQTGSKKCRLRHHNPALAPSLNKPRAKFAFCVTTRIPRAPETGSVPKKQHSTAADTQNPRRLPHWPSTFRTRFALCVFLSVLGVSAFQTQPHLWIFALVMGRFWPVPGICVIHPENVGGRKWRRSQSVRSAEPQMPFASSQPGASPTHSNQVQNSPFCVIDTANQADNLFQNRDVCVIQSKFHAPNGCRAIAPPSQTLTLRRIRQINSRCPDRQRRKLYFAIM